MTKDLSKQNYIGRVVYTDDPDFSGRCKVRVFGLLDSKDEQGNYSIPDDMLPWFVPISSNIFSGSAGNSSVNISGANEVNVDGSTINLDGNTVTLGAGANQHAVLGEELVKVLRLLASEIAQKYPVTPSNPDPFQINSVLSNKVMIG